MQFNEMADLGRRLWGAPSKVHSTREKIRFGTNGSKCIDLKNHTFFDHETGKGGGYADLYEQVHGARPADTAIAVTYEYRDETGVLLFEVVRKRPKKFVQRRPDGNGGWEWSTKGVRRVPYRLAELLKAQTTTPVFIVEGEKDVDALRDHLLVATTNPGGAGKWQANFAPYFRDRNVVILPDNDQAGEDHAADVAKKLSGVAASIKILKLEGLREKGDVSDWLAAGHTVEELEKLAVETAPEKVVSRDREERNRQTERKPEPHIHQQSADLPEVGKPEALSYHALRDQLDKNNNGAVLPTHANLLLILKQDPLLADLVEFNSFSGLHMLRKPVPTLNKATPPKSSYPRPWDAEDVTRLLAYVQKAWAHNFKRATVEECLLLEGRDNEVHGVRSYLDGLRWDGAKRLDSWLAQTFGCPEDDYHKAVGAKILIAAVRRVRQPGCKFDQMAVLEGPQNIGKSTSILILFGADWFTDQISDLSSKDAAIDLRGKWCVELAEIEHIIRAEVETVKAFLSRATDHYRPPYGKISVDLPRQCILMGTTNATEYLRDATGNRRIWPVKCLKASSDLEWLRINRDQLWAEASHREAAYETIWLDDAATSTVAVQAQAARLAEDPWHDKVRDYVEDLPTTTVSDLFDHVLYVPTERQTKSLEMRVAAILKSLGWDKKLQWNKETKKPFKAWFPPVNGG